MKKSNTIASVKDRQEKKATPKKRRRHKNGKNNIAAYARGKKY
jgi:hypothetical protein